MFAIVKDVEAALGRPIVDAGEIERVNRFIAVVERMITRRAGARADSLNNDDVAYVVGESVARRLEGPGGKRNERIDDYSYGLTDEAARMGLFLTDDEWALILPQAGAGGCWTIPVGPPVVGRRLPWWLS